MKTSVYLSTLLVFAIQGMVNGQTLATQVEHHNETFLYGTFKRVEMTKEDKKHLPEKTSATESENQVAQQSIVTINKRIEDYNKQFEELKALKTKLDEDINSFFVQQNATTQTSTTTYQTTIISTSSTTITYTKQEQLTVLLNQATEISIQSQTIRRLSKTSTTEEQAKLLAQARELDKQFILKQIEALDLSGKISYEKYGQNQFIIQTLLTAYKGANVQQVTNLVSEAETFIKLSKEIREEANAQLTTGAKYGAMSNAEEKEWLALNKQDKAIGLLQTNGTASVYHQKDFVCYAK